jgi:TDG/mug DNA glycosylase family protein
VGPAGEHDRPESVKPPDDELAGLTLPDLIDPRVDLLFVGINPGRKSALLGHYYAGPGNLFWRCLHESGLTPVLLKPQEDRRVLEWGIGITDCVKRASRMASEVRLHEFRSGLPDLLSRIEGCRPRLICFNGLMGYRQAFDPAAELGLQPTELAGAKVFVVPSTSAANAGFTREERVEWFRRVRELRNDLCLPRRDRPVHGPVV